jgi:anti-sigma regulatory factor (Ser/Thr protein kinase)
MRSIEIQMRNEISELARVRDALDSLGEELPVRPRVLMQLQVALDEIVSNVVKYSWSDGADHEFLVRITADTETVTLEIIDDGVAFDPRSAPNLDALPADRRPHLGGRGIHMIRQLVDDFAYRRIDGRNHTTLTKHCAIGAALEEK